MIRVFTAFSGYDSQCLALDRLQAAYPDRFGYELVGWSEIDKYAIQAHNALFPEYADRNYGDISKIDWHTVPDFDLFTYSSPCQDFSQAGLQRGGEKGSGSRSSLLWECERAIREKRPKYLLMENVAALVSRKFIRLFNQWQLTLERLGYRNFAKILNAKHYGVPQNRERIFMVSILDESARYEFPKPIILTRRLKDVLEKNVDEKYYLSVRLLPCVLLRIDKKRTILNCMQEGTASALTAKSSPSSQTNMVGVKVLFDLQPDNKWQGCVIREQNKVVLIQHTAPTLNSTIYKHTWKIAEPTMLGWSRNDKGEVVNYHSIEVSNAITSAKRDNTQNYIVGTINTDNDGCARTINTHYSDMNAESVMSKSRNGYGYVRTAVVEIDGAYYRIRKLTERECFRLMDVSETDIDKIQAAGISRSQQYKTAGNSIVVSCLCHIFDKLFINTEISEKTLFDL